MSYTLRTIQTIKATRIMVPRMPPIYIRISVDAPVGYLRHVQLSPSGRYRTPGAQLRRGRHPKRPTKPPTGAFGGFSGSARVGSAAKGSRGSGEGCSASIFSRIFVIRSPAILRMALRLPPCSSRIRPRISSRVKPRFCDRLMNRIRSIMAGGYRRTSAPLCGTANRYRRW
jgi:hypothetical protein